MAGILREFNGWEDRLEMMRLVERNPANSVHVLDMPYRLSSPSLDDPRGVGLWENEAGVLTGFAVIQWAWQTLDFGYAPDSGLEQQILAWAIERFPQLSKNYLTYEHPLLFIDAPQDDSAKISLLEMNGFKNTPGKPPIL